MEIVELTEKIRECGFRLEGANYLMGGKLSAPCGRIPFDLPVCECCGRDWDHFRGIRKIDAATLMRDKNPPRCTRWEGRARKLGDTVGCTGCPMFRPAEQAWMMWVGAKVYSTREFLDEAREKGISKRVVEPPKAFVYARDVVYLAHKQAVLYVEDGVTKTRAGIFATFTPSHVDFVVGEDGNLTEQQHRIHARINETFAGGDNEFTRVVRITPDRDSSDPE